MSARSYNDENDNYVTTSESVLIEHKDIQKKKKKIQK